MSVMVTRIKAGLVLLLLCRSTPCLGQVKVPDTPAGQKLAEWLAVFNRGDLEAYKAFLEKNYPSHHQPADQAMALFVNPVVSSLQPVASSNFVR